MTTSTKAKAITIPQIIKQINSRFLVTRKDGDGLLSVHDSRGRISALLKEGWLTTGQMLLRVEEKMAAKILEKLPPPTDAMKIKDIPKARKDLEDWDLKFYETEQTYDDDGAERLLHAVYAHVHGSPIFMVQSRLLLFVLKNIPKDAKVKTCGSWLQWYVGSDDFPVAVLAGVKK